MQKDGREGDAAAQAGSSPESPTKIRKEYLTAVYELSGDAPVEVSQRDVERSFLVCIELGNPDLYERQLNALRAGRIHLKVGRMSTNSLLQEQFGAVATITLGCRAAIDGGLPEQMAYRISDVFIQHLAMETDKRAISQLVTEAMLEYCRVVRDWRVNRCSPQVRACCEYVLTHLHQAIRLTDLSRASRLSASYLSSRFVAELGIRPSAYVRQQKLIYARHILDLYDIPIMDLSYLLAFPSPSAFSQQFKREFGITPARYRSAHDA